MSRSSRALVGLALLGGVGLAPLAQADTLTFCSIVEEYQQVSRGYYLYDACPPTTAQPDGKASTPLGDPTQCWTFLLPTNPYDELPMSAFKIPVQPVTPTGVAESAGAQTEGTAPVAETPQEGQ
jgi:hypothetical protein